jgi:hypothetical protein
MYEYEPYLQDTSARPFDRYQPERQDFAALPAWLIAADTGRRTYAFGQPTYNERGVAYSWSGDNLGEVENGILGRAAGLGELAQATGVEEGVLVAAIWRWNDACGNGRDDNFGRPPSSMVPIADPPFYYAPVWPVVSNTQGRAGPRRRPAHHRCFRQPHSTPLRGGQNGQRLRFFVHVGGQPGGMLFRRPDRRAQCGPGAVNRVKRRAERAEPPTPRATKICSQPDLAAPI